eukprot:Amastigsp_a508623_729.p3 type:complete len:130 gc:universal Amastigsp_a508623_729:2595-2984(+)
MPSQARATTRSPRATSTLPTRSAQSTKTLSGSVSRIGASQTPPSRRCSSRFLSPRGGSTSATWAPPVRHRRHLATCRCRTWPRAQSPRARRPTTRRVSSSNSRRKQQPRLRRPQQLTTMTMTTTTILYE